MRVGYTVLSRRADLLDVVKDRPGVVVGDVYVDHRTTYNVPNGDSPRKLNDRNNQRAKSNRAQVKPAPAR